MKQWNHITMNKGFSLVEALLAGAIFSLITTALVGSFLYGQEATVLAGKRARASFLAKEGLEAVRNIRDENFSNLVDGTHGLAVTSNQWNFSGSSDITDIFTRELQIFTINADTKQVVANVTWQQNLQRSGLVALTSYLTNWDNVVASSTCGQYCQDQGYVSGSCRQNSQQCIINNETYEMGGDPYCIDIPQIDTCCCVSALVADVIAPDAITNLVLSNATINSIDLDWTAVGDDGIIGTATSYDIRYSLVLITEANWAGATQAVGEPIPLVAGSAEAVTVGGLLSNTLYYFAIKTSDEALNTSLISNVPNLTTLSPPITTCSELCQSLSYSDGTCRKNSGACSKVGETYETSGDTYCIGGKNSDTCCCAP